MAAQVEDLLADTTYNLVDEGGYVTGINFTTGSGPDETAPACEIGASEDGDPMHVWISCDEEIALARIEAPIDLGTKYYLFTPTDDCIHFESISGKYEGGYGDGHVLGRGRQLYRCRLHLPGDLRLGFGL